ncbi:MAG: hypothetical protein K2G04_06375, partial [Oscillospiraceae bacterium]|nr:hypothetical protein [Oscillospiraceae bacterium]
QIRCGKACHESAEGAGAGMKRVKNAVIVFSIIAVWFLIFLVLPKILRDKTLYLFGNFIPESIFWVLQWLPVFAAELAIHIKFFKEYNIFKKITYTLLSCVIAAYMVYVTTNTVNGFLAKEEINLPDGNKIVLYENTRIVTALGERGTVIEVYKAKGIIAKKIGICWESLYCDDYCLNENKWDYIYDEADKKLTLLLSYDEQKDENDTGFLSKEFTLE